jgi:hypothetical protein
MNPQLIHQTKILVEKYDESLKVIANLNSENRSLRDEIDKEKLKASKLVEHYEQRLCDQTSRFSSLKEIIRVRDATEKEERRKRRAQDESITIKLRDAQIKDDKILLLEKEEETLKCIQIQQRDESERKYNAAQAAMKESFDKKLEISKQQLLSGMYEEMGDVLSRTMEVNDQLTAQLKAVLAELESMKVSQDEKEKEISMANREIKLLKYKEKMIAQRKKEKERERAYLMAMRERQQGQEQSSCDD